MKLPAWADSLLDGWWPLWIVIAALAASGLALLLWAFFADPSRGRRRCPR